MKGVEDRGDGNGSNLKLLGIVFFSGGRELYLFPLSFCVFNDGMALVDEDGGVQRVNTMMRFIRCSLFMLPVNRDCELRVLYCIYFCQSP